MTREQLIEPMADADLKRVSGKLADIYDQYVRESATHPETFADSMEYLVAAIHDAGLCIVPREATEAMVMDGQMTLVTKWNCSDVYRAMIEAGKL